MSYGRIRRGPMAADAFTQIRNAVFRDPRLSAKAMGIFGNISTHRDGWGVSAESIASQMRDGVAAIKGGLRELEEYGYLRRTQVRHADGTLGGAAYFITDQPETMPESSELPALPEDCRSEPSVENRPADATSGDGQNRRSEPSVDSPPADKPPAENHLHKKTSSKHTSLKKTLSRAAVPSAATGERRETFAALDNDDAAKVVEAWIAARGRGRNPVFEQAVRESAALLLAAEWSIPDLVALAEDMARRQPTYSDLARHEPHWVRPVAHTVAGERPSMVTADTSGRDHECTQCDRPIKPGPPGRLCRDCQEE